jgi:hypothetical protein
MQVRSGDTTKYKYFKLVDATDLKTPETGASITTVYRSRNGAAEVAMTTPTVTEIDATNMPGIYALLMDEDMTLDSGDDWQEMAYRVVATGCAPAEFIVDIVRRAVTNGETLTVASGIAQAAVQSIIANAITAASINADAITAAKVAADVHAEAADAIWDEAQAGHTTGGSFGEIATEIAAILVDTAEIGAAGAGLTEAGGTGDHLTALATAAALATIAAYLDTEIAAILADTNELQTDLVDGGRLDLLIDAIKAKTDNLPSDPADASVVAGLIAAAEAKIDILDGNVDQLELGIIYGVAETGTLTTTAISSDLTGYANDQLIGRSIYFTSGAAEGEAREITDYVETDGVISFAALTTAPGNGDTFKIV